MLFAATVDLEIIIPDEVEPDKEKYHDILTVYVES